MITATRVDGDEARILEVWSAASGTTPGVDYLVGIVRWRGHEFTMCTCPGWRFSGKVSPSGAWPKVWTKTCRHTEAGRPAVRRKRVAA
ncbi:MAG: hypothetical protein ACHQ0J_13515 [Candidatus Dormibacterales bacterium]